LAEEDKGKSKTIGLLFCWCCLLFVVGMTHFCFNFRLLLSAC
jgi:hypothetical protein